MLQSVRQVCGCTSRPTLTTKFQCLTLETGPNEIDRFDRRLYVTVTATLGSTPLGAAVQAARTLPAAMQLPPGITLSDSGNAENMNDLISGFGLAMPASVLGIYCVLVLLFHDFVQLLTILSALPLSLGGAFVALLVSANVEGPIR